jgi:two-component system cell cycle sensor histidine kinase/response regulator CckA
VDAAASAPGPPPVPGAPPVGRGETILLVEDEPAIRKLAHFGLSRHGFTVIDAADCSEALAAWREHSQQICLLLTDLMLPGELSGIGLARRLREERADLKVLYASGYAAGTDPLGEGAIEEGAMVQKPYELAALARTIRASLDRV